MSVTSSMIESSKTSAQNCNNCKGNKFQLSHEDCNSNSCSTPTTCQNQSTSSPTTSSGTKIVDSNVFDVKNQVVVDNVATISQMNYTKCHVGSSTNVHSLTTCTPQLLTKNSSITTRSLHFGCTENDSEKCYSYNSRNIDANIKRMHDLDMNSAHTLQNSIVHPTNNHPKLTEDILKGSSLPSNGFQVNFMIYCTFLIRMTEGYL